MPYKFLRKYMLSEKIVIDGQTFNEGQELYEIIEDNINEDRIVYLDRQDIRKILEFGNEISGLPLECIDKEA